MMARMKKSVHDLRSSDLSGKTVFLRADLNVPLKDGLILDDSRITEALPTIQYLKKSGAKLVLASHLARPNGEVVDALRLTPIQKRLSELLDMDVQKTDDCIGESVKQSVSSLQSGDVLLLENIRFYKEETENDTQFAKQLADLADIFVLDAFGTAHRAHASTVGIASFLPAYSGLLLTKELTFLSTAIKEPKRPFMAIVGGSKVSTKLPVLQSLLDVVDFLYIGGGMVFTFMKAQGFSVGTSLVESEHIETAARFLEHAAKSKTEVLFPHDHLIADSFSNDALTSVVDNDSFPDTMMGLDIGPKSLEFLCHRLQDMKMVLWNGPVGVFELSNFAKGTMGIAEALASNDCISIVGGGDSVSAIKQAGVSDGITHISTGGGASLELLEGKDLPGISVLLDKE